MPPAQRTIERHEGGARALAFAWVAVLAACGGDASTAMRFAAGREAGASDAAPLADAAGGDAAPARVDASALPDVKVELDAGREDDAGRETAAVLPRERTALVDHMRWSALAANDDPFGDRPSAVTCDARGHGYERFSGEDAFSVDTSQCDYLVAHQPSSTEVRAGELVKVRLWHFMLDAPTNAEAHIVLRLGATTLLDERVPIPSPGGLLTARWTAPTEVAVGEPVLLHVHNHGANPYALIEVSTGPAEE